MDEINFYLKDEMFGWLSNFFPSAIIVDQVEYDTVEHYYQSQKTNNPAIKYWIRTAPKPYLAMIAGRALREKDEKHSAWETAKVDVMKFALWKKFEDPTLRALLLQTGDLPIHEDSPTDMYWGKKGEDMLGKLLMRVRKEIRQGVHQI